MSAVAPAKAGLISLAATLFIVVGQGQAPSPGTATISGIVTNAATGLPVANASIIIRRRDAAPSDPTVSTRTDDRGRYRSPGLAAGEYTVEAWPQRSSPELVRLIYKAYPCPYTGCQARPRDVVTVTASNETSEINFALPVGGSISGTVVDETTREPLPHVLVTAKSDTFEARAVSAEGGRFTIHALTSGSYAVEARPAWEGVLGAPRELGLRLEQLLTQRYRVPVVVTAPLTTANIDFSLVPRAHPEPRR